MFRGIQRQGLANQPGGYVVPVSCNRRAKALDPSIPIVTNKQWLRYRPLKIGTGTVGSKTRFLRRCANGMIGLLVEKPGLSTDLLATGAVPGREILNIDYNLPWLLIRR